MHEKSMLKKYENMTLYYVFLVIVLSFMIILLINNITMRMFKMYSLTRLSGVGGEVRWETVWPATMISWTGRAAW